MLPIHTPKLQNLATVSLPSLSVPGLVCRSMGSRHLVQREFIMNVLRLCDLLCFLYFGGGGVGEGRLSLAEVLFLLEFSTLSAGHSESQIILSFCLPSFGLHWQPDGIMNSLRRNSCGQECVGSLSEPCSLTL